MRSIFAVLMIVAIAAIPASAQVIVKGGGMDRNPTVLFKGVSGSQQMSSQVLSDLRFCGWFDVVESGSSDYVVSGSSSGNALKLDLANAAGVGITSVNASGEAVDMASHKAVDAILKYLFKIDGVCRTKIVFCAEVGPTKKEIYVCDFDGRNFKKLTNNNTLSVEPVWSPNGKSVIYSFYGRSYTDLVELDLTTNRSRHLTQFPGLNAGGRISPDGSRVALVLSKDNQVDLYTRSVNGTDLRRLTKDKAVEASPCWSPDGSRICYVSDGGNAGRPSLYVMPASGGSATRLQTVGSEAVSPSWSKDNKIAYSAKLGNYTVAVLDLEGTAGISGGARSTGSIRGMSGVIVSKGGDWEGPSWAPDCRQVVCAQGRELHVVDTWTGKTRKLVGGASKVSLPDWSNILY